MDQPLPQFHETEVFQAWLRKRELMWPDSLLQQDWLMREYWEEFWRLGAERAAAAPDRVWVGTSADLGEEESPPKL